jgi:hypothetical protein
MTKIKGAEGSVQAPLYPLVRNCRSISVPAPDCTHSKTAPAKNAANRISDKPQIV